jgi:hypothetical protein
MKKDVLNALSGIYPNTIPSKETLNHPGIIHHVTGIDPFEDTPKAFEIAWEKLGIDIHVAKPRANAKRPTKGVDTWKDGNLRFSPLGIYPTSAWIEYCPHIPKTDIEWPFQYDATKDGFLSEDKVGTIPDMEMHATFRPEGGLAGEGNQGTIRQLREVTSDFNRYFGNKAVQYHIYYTTLFMWPIVKFGWEPFVMAATYNPEKFNEQLWKPWSEASRKYCEIAATLDSEVIFMHDDIVSGTGPIFPPEFYEEYIFSRYNYILDPLVKAGKKIVYVCDGNLDYFLERLLDFPFDALQFENPATPFERILETWGKAGKGFIGGISTELLTNGTPEDVKKHTRKVIEAGRIYPGFIISSCGGLHGDIPLQNIIAYFETRNEMGIPADLTQNIVIQ